MAQLVHMKTEQGSSRRLQRQMAEMGSFVRAETKTIVRNTGRDFVRFAVRETPIAPFNHEGKRVTGRGFAKAGWFLAMGGLGMTISSSHHKRGGQKGLDFGLFINNLDNKDNPSVTIGNRIPYIEEIRHPILIRAMTQTNNRMEKTLNQMSQRMVKRWRR